MAQPETTARLARAKQYIAIAESGDAKREAYRQAGLDIQAVFYDGVAYTAIAVELGRSDKYVGDLGKWAERAHENGTDLPFRRDEKDTHEIRQQRDTAKVLANAPIEEVERIMADLPPERRQAVAKAIEDTHPANRSKPPLGVPKADVTFLTRMAGPINRLRHAIDTFVVDYEAHIEDAHEDDVELVREEVAPLLAKVSALTTDWSVR